MKVVAENRLAKQVNAEVPSLMNQLFINPHFAIIEVLPADRIITQQKQRRTVRFITCTIAFSSAANTSTRAITSRVSAKN